MGTSNQELNRITTDCPDCETAEPRSASSVCSAKSNEAESREPLSPSTGNANAIGRRGFFAAAGALLAAPSVWSGIEKQTSAENLVGELYKILPSDVKKVVCLSAEHKLRAKASANWAITPPKISTFSPKHQEMCERIVASLASPEGAERFKKQMEEDSGGIGDYHVAFFGAPGDKNFEFVLTGRHATLRADGTSDSGPAFGGPMVYGHQGPSGDPEDKDHSGNVFWRQALQANEVFKALDPKQRKVALVAKAPREDSITHRRDGFSGLAVGDMSPDQQALVEKTMGELLSPYRKQDVDEVLAVLKANGGLQKTRLAFFQSDEAGKNADIGNDKTWDIWRLEGPGFIWHFRGAPHVHAWVNITRV